MKMDLEKLFIEENVGGWDLLLRAFIGSAGVVLWMLGLVRLDAPWSWVYGLAVFVCLFTSITRHCSPYGLIGLSTKKK